jgi:hypothetical protein
MHVTGKFRVKLAIDCANDGQNLVRPVVYVELERQVLEEFFSKITILN